MANTQKRQAEASPQRVALTARLSLAAYDAIVAVQRQHRIQTGRALPIWKIIDTAVQTYAQLQNDVNEKGK